MPVISVIIPAYRVTSYIAETLDSVMLQTFRDFETIVVNDGCPDTENLERALQPYLPKIHYIRQSNMGVSAARNAGLGVAAGEYVAFLDSDDLWLPEHLSKQYAYLREHPELELVYADAELFGSPVFNGKRFMELCPSEGEPSVEALLAEQCTVITSTVVAKRSAVERAGRFDVTLSHGEDFGLWVKILKTGGKIGYQQQVSIRHRKHSSSLTANPQTMADSQLRLLDKIEALGLTSSEQAALKGLREKIIAEKQLAAGKIYLRAGDAKAARTALEAANTYFRLPKLTAVLLLLRFVPWAAWFWKSETGSSSIPTATGSA
jgi:glycosyltransferase involved in cell wall biosynthesis